MSHRRTVAATALCCALVLGGASGCTVKPETIRTYTPAHGVNTDVKDTKVRNLVISVDEAGKGTLYGMLVSRDGDRLSGVTGVALDSGSKDAGPLTITGAKAELKPGQAVQLEQLPSTVSGKNLKAGLHARLTVRLERGGEVTLEVPVMDKNHPDYTAAPQG